MTSRLTAVLAMAFTAGIAVVAPVSAQQVVAATPVTTSVAGAPFFGSIGARNRNCWAFRSPSQRSRMCAAGSTTATTGWFSTSVARWVATGCSTTLITRCIRHPPPIRAGERIC